MWDLLFNRDVLVAVRGYRWYMVGGRLRGVGVLARGGVPDMGHPRYENPSVARWRKTVATYSVIG